MNVWNKKKLVIGCVEIDAKKVGGSIYKIF